jgi:hypothetical protein
MPSATKMISTTLSELFATPHFFSFLLELSGDVWVSILDRLSSILEQRSSDT